MSRIGKKIIELPKDVNMKVDGELVSVKGKKGELNLKLHSSMNVAVEGTSVHVKPKKGPNFDSNFHGLTRSLVQNMITGVSKGFVKELVLKGVGYRAAIQGKELNLVLGYSHPVNYSIPEGIQIKVDKFQGKDPLVVVEGCDKEKVGQVAAEIRSFRKPEPYHGKGIRYADEVIVTKVGKSAKK